MLERKDGLEAFCMLGALGEASNSLRIGAVKAVARATGCDERGIGIEIAKWNDHPRRTQAEVVAAFERAERFILE